MLKKILALFLCLNLSSMQCEPTALSERMALMSSALSHTARFGKCSADFITGFNTAENLGKSLLPYMLATLHKAQGKKPGRDLTESLVVRHLAFFLSHVLANATENDSLVSCLLTGGKDWLLTRPSSKYNEHDAPLSLSLARIATQDTNHHHPFHHAISGLTHLASTILVARSTKNVLADVEKICRLLDIKSNVTTGVIPPKEPHIAILTPSAHNINFLVSSFICPVVAHQMNKSNSCKSDHFVMQGLLECINMASKRFSRTFIPLETVKQLPSAVQDTLKNIQNRETVTHSWDLVSFCDLLAQI